MLVRLLILIKILKVLLAQRMSFLKQNPIASKIVYDLKDTGRNLTGVNHIPDYDSQVSAMQSYLPTKKIAESIKKHVEELL
jgi:hypothetical protein